MNRFFDTSSVRTPLRLSEDFPASENASRTNDTTVEDSDASLFWWIFGTQVFAR